MRNASSKQSGFTLMEVAAVAAISGLLAAFSLPMVNTLKAEQAFSGVIDTFNASVQAARETAVSSGSVVSICPSADGHSCSQSWRDGWIAYRGEQTNNIEPSNIVLYVDIEPEAEITVYGEAAEHISRLRFDANGYNQAASRLTVSFCANDADMSTVVVEATGRMLNTTGNEEFQNAFVNSVRKAHSHMPAQCNPA